MGRSLHSHAVYKSWPRSPLECSLPYSPVADDFKLVFNIRLAAHAQR